MTGIVMLQLASLLLALPYALAADDGVARLPPMGWRSWNLYGISLFPCLIFHVLICSKGANVNQDLMQNVMDGLISRKRMVDGKPTSLCDLGYCDVGLDDNWQECGSYGVEKFTYHDGAGFPVVNKGRFRDFIAMTDYAHARNLTAGWYLNNCICSDHCGSGSDSSESDFKCYEGDVASLIEFGFDSVKLDGCGKQRDLNVWSNLMNASGKAIQIENCHWGQVHFIFYGYVSYLKVSGSYKQTLPNATWCPWNLYGF